MDSSYGLKHVASSLWLKKKIRYSEHKAVSLLSIKHDTTKVVTEILKRNLGGLSNIFETNKVGHCIKVMLMRASESFSAFLGQSHLTEFQFSTGEIESG